MKNSKCKVRPEIFYINNNNHIYYPLSIKVNKCSGSCIDKGACDKGFIWNPGNCECECDKSCNVGECLDYSDCKCKKKLANRLIDECIETIEETKIVNITVGNKNYYECTSCIVYIVLMIVAFTIFIAITVYLIYYNWYLINNNNNYNHNHNNNDDDDDDDDDDDNDDKNKKLMNVIIKN